MPTGSLNLLFEPAISAGNIQDPGLKEASGLIASRQNPGLLWVINDSGNEPKLFLINGKAETVRTYWLNNQENHDWEDLAIYRDKSTGKNKLMIGDIGDNFSGREYIEIIILDEPKFMETNDTIISDFEVYKFSYEDGARDAETIICDPITSGIYIISKREENVGIFEVPKTLSNSTIMTLNEVSNLPFNNITSGDISIDGNEILLKTYDEIFYWQRDIKKLIVSELANDHQLINYEVEPQGESICWNVEGTGFFTLSEKSWANEQILYFYKKVSDN
jgi:hypothetical protein